MKEWWSDSALKEFNRRAKCIEKQYSKYKVQDKHPVSNDRSEYIFSYA